MRDLSVLIPARNEEWLNKTVSDVQDHAQADTEIIVVLDGAWPKEPLPQHPSVQVVYLPESIGQRAAVNLAARISTARYVMKLDAHCAVDDGFDVKLIQAAQELGDDVTQIPAQHNLHVFNWVCDGCGHVIYQGPTPTACVACPATTHHRDIVWNPIRRRTVGWRFDSELHFQYWGELQHRTKGAEFIETMSCLGACWFQTLERFWQLGGLDTEHGSWGQCGVEVACKAWLSGGRLVTNTRTWFSHCFRTQGGDFSFPYAIHGSDQEKARQYSRDLWRGNKWEGQVRPLRWLVEKFAPVPGWTQEQINALPEFSGNRQSPEKAGRGDRVVADTNPRSATQSHTAGIVYYSDCRPEALILDASRRTIEQSGLPIVSVTLAPIRWPAARNIVLSLERSALTMFRQILAGLEAIDTDLVFFCEHDVLYAREHFHFCPPTPDAYYYNINTWKVDVETGRAVTYETKQTSGLCADRRLLIAHYRKRIRCVESQGFSRRMGFEPGSHRRPERIDDVPSVSWTAAVPNIDLRHSANLTPSRWSPDKFRDKRSCQGWQEAEAVPGWGHTKGRMRELLMEVSHAAQQAVA